MRSSNNLENKIPSVTYYRVQLGCMKVQARRSAEPPSEYNLDAIPLRFVLEKKACKEIPQPLKFQ